MSFLAHVWLFLGTSTVVPPTRFLTVGASQWWTVTLPTISQNRSCVCLFKKISWLLSNEKLNDKHKSFRKFMKTNGLAHILIFLVQKILEFMPSYYYYFIGSAFFMHFHEQMFIWEGTECNEIKDILILKNYVKLWIKYCWKHMCPENWITVLFLPLIPYLQFFLEKPETGTDNCQPQSLIAVALFPE